MAHQYSLNDIGELLERRSQEAFIEDDRNQVEAILEEMGLDIGEFFDTCIKICLNHGIINNEDELKDQLPIAVSALITGYLFATKNGAHDGD